jgi:hypothetical protein
VFPLQPCSKIPFPGSRGFKDGTTNPAALLRWPTDANVGVATGNGLVVLDVDGDVGADALHELEREHGRLPETPSVKTPNGTHLYFRTRARVKCNAGKLAPAVDVRGEGGYVVCPPSVVDGKPYVWDLHPDDVPLAHAPEWLLEPSTERRLATPAETWLTMVREGLPRGQRNVGLARLFGYLIARDVDARVAHELAHAVNARNRPPLPGAEVDRICESIATAELEKRRAAR